MNKTALILSIASMLTCSIPTTPVKAITADTKQVFTDEIQPRTVGLITSYEIYVSERNGNLCINGYTKSGNKMKTIGFKDISVEYSSDGVNWNNEKSSFDLLNSDSNSYYLNNYSVSVNGGFYYRVSLNHYAKESGWFGSSQSVSNTSNSVWID